MTSLSWSFTYVTSMAGSVTAELCSITHYLHEYLITNLTPRISPGTLPDYQLTPLSPTSCEVYRNSQTRSCLIFESNGMPDRSVCSFDARCQSLTIRTHITFARFTPHMVFLNSLWFTDYGCCLSRCGHVSWFTIGNTYLGYVMHNQSRRVSNKRDKDNET